MRMHACAPVFCFVYSIHLIDPFLPPFSMIDTHLTQERTIILAIVPANQVCRMLHPNLAFRPYILAIYIYIIIVLLCVFSLIHLLRVLLHSYLDYHHHITCYYP